MKNTIGSRAICARCDLEIEFIGKKTWQDRGGNSHCYVNEEYTFKHKPHAE